MDFSVGVIAACFVVITATAVLTVYLKWFTQVRAGFVRIAAVVRDGDRVTQYHEHRDVYVYVKNEGNVSVNLGKLVVVNRITQDRRDLTNYDFAKFVMLEYKPEDLVKDVYEIKSSSYGLTALRCHPCSENLFHIRTSSKSVFNHVYNFIQTHDLIFEVKLPTGPVEHLVALNGESLCGSKRYVHPAPEF